jgi:hypothetical protein
VPADELIPAEFEGIRTDVVRGGDFVKLADPSGGLPTEERYDIRHRPLVGGCSIAVVDSRGRGTLGCLLRHTSEAAKIYALTNHHVVNPPDMSASVVGTTEVGQPLGEASCSDCCDDRIGKYAGGGMTDDRDEALVQLTAGMTWQAEILEIGVVAGRHTVTQAEAATGTYAVRKHGMRTRLTGGVISALDASTGVADNIMIVAPNPHPDAGTRTVFFVYEGDSGAVLVNGANEVVGLIDARDDAGNGTAFPIEHVLDRFAAVESVAVEVATATTPGTVNTVPGAAMVTVPPEVVSSVAPASTPVPAGRVLAPVPGWVLPVAPPGSAVLGHVADDLGRSAAGRRLLALWDTHRAELRRLLEANRRVATTWHRSGASALFQLLARMAVDPTVSVPETVHGRPLDDVLDRVHEMFRRVAGPQLRADLDAVRPLVPPLAGLTYPQAVAALGTG